MKTIDGIQTKVRCFLGIKVDALESLSPLREELVAIASNTESKLRPTTDTNLHLTLQFFAAIDKNLLVPVSGLTEQLAARHCAMRLQLQGIRIFRNAIVIGVESAPELMSLAEECRLTFTALGLNSLDKKYVPHITVARFGRNARLPLEDISEKYGAQDWGEFHADSISLFQSETRPEGASYSILSSAPLKNS